MIPATIKRVAYKALGTSNFLLATGLYQVRRGEGSYRTFLELLPQKGRLLDIGANIGVTTAIARKKRPDLEVISFEPLSLNVKAAKRLCRVLRVSNVDFREVALGDQQGTVEMAMPTIGDILRTPQSYVVYDGYTSPIAEAAVEKFTVPVKTIDSLHLPKVDGIKIDVENYESFVFRGAIELLKRDLPMIYCELWMSEAGITENGRDVVAILTGLGYTYKKVDDKDYLFQHAT